MIEFYHWPTPNGHKITIFLEEAGLDYRLHPVNIGKGEQFKPEFLAISPNNRIPAITDPAPADGGAPVSLFESGAILLYLAEKTGKFISSDPRSRADTLQWLFWQMANLGPMADIASYPWIVPHERYKQNLDDFPHLKRWFEAIAARQAVAKVYSGGAKKLREADDR